MQTAKGGIAFRSAPSRLTLVDDDKSLSSTMDAEWALSERVQSAYTAHRATTPPPSPTELLIQSGSVGDFVVQAPTGQPKATLHAIQNLELVDVAFLRLLIPPGSLVHRVILISDHECSMYDLDKADPKLPLLDASRSHIIKIPQDIASVVSDVCRDGWLMGNSRM